MKNKKLIPVGDRILIEPVAAADKIGSLFIPEQAKEKPTEGIVRGLGTGKRDEKGKRIPFEVKVGDRVLTSKYGATEIEVDGQKLKITTSDDILAILS